MSVLLTAIIMASNSNAALLSSLNERVDALKVIIEELKAAFEQIKSENAAFMANQTTHMLQLTDLISSVVGNTTVTAVAAETTTTTTRTQPDAVVPSIKGISTGATYLKYLMSSNKDFAERYNVKDLYASLLAAHDKPEVIAKKLFEKIKNDSAAKELLNKDRLAHNANLTKGSTPLTEE